MGLDFFHSLSSYDNSDIQLANDLEVDTPKSRTNPKNPDPENFIILEALSIEKLVVLKIEYPDCTNYEGKKILVFRGLTIFDIVSRSSIDPHFSKKKPEKSPIARFLPTDEGWHMAIRFCKNYSGIHNNNADKDSKIK